MMSLSRSVVIVSGMVAGVPWQGGAAWAVLQYVLGLRLLGCEVYLIEEIPADVQAQAGANGITFDQERYFRRICDDFDLRGSAGLCAASMSEIIGMSRRSLIDIAGRADVLINIAGMWPLTNGFDKIPVRLYLDLDPGFTQIWSQTPDIDMRFNGHTHFATVGLAIGSTSCMIPTVGQSWIPTLPPVALEYWPVSSREPTFGMTTVANWRGYGSVEHGGLHYGQKAHSWRQFMELPRLSAERFVAALAIHPDEKSDLVALRANAWCLLDPASVAATPSNYQRFIQKSKAELGIAKSGYVISGSGWFSDRSACYLASGRPVLAQDTGYSQYLPTDEGLLAFTNLREALQAIDAINDDYARHAKAARAVAEEYFSSTKVIRSLFSAIGVEV